MTAYFRFIVPNKRICTLILILTFSFQTLTKADDIKDLVRSRFTTGEQAMGSTLAAVKDIGYMASLGQLRSAATQIKDLGTSAYLHGIMPTIKGALNVRSNILDKTGLADTVSAEMATSQGTTKLLNSVLKLSMFRAVDRFGKRTLLEASRIKGTKLASSPKGVAILRKKYGEAYGNDFDNNDNPYECGFDQYVSLDSDINFLGKEKLKEVKLKGPQKKLMGVKINIKEISLTGSKDIYDENNKVIGELRSACYSPHFQKVIGIAMIQKSHWEVSQSFKIQVNGNTINGNVCDLPFI